MEPTSIALSIVKALCAKVEHVRTNADDCKQLAGFAERTVPLLEHLATYSAADMGVSRALDVVVEALELADEAVSECCKSTALVSMLYSDKLGDQLKKATSTLSYALSLLTAVNVGLAAEMQEEMFNLKQQLKNVHFSQAAAARGQAGELKRLLEFGFNSNSEATEEMKEMMKELLQIHSKTQEEQQADLQLLKGCLADARRNKERLEEYELQQVIDAIEAGAAGSQKQPERAPSSADADLLSHLVCPITMERMTDPVIVKESGMTYDRSNILEWFARGHRNDPQTNVPLISTELVPNVCVRRLLHSAIKREGGSPPEGPSEKTSTDSIVPLKPGLLEGKRRGNHEDVGKGVVNILLILDVAGNVIGFQESISDASESHTRVEITGGRWDQESIKFYYAGNGKGVAIAEGAFSCPSSPYVQALCLKLAAKYPVREVDRYSGMEREQFSGAGTAEFKWITQPPPILHYEMGCGLIQMDGRIHRQNGDECPNRLLLLLQGGGAIKGWMSGDAEEVSSSVTCGKVHEGSWNAADSTLTFRLDYFADQPFSPSGEEQLFLCRSVFIGVISHSFQVAAVQGPAFTGVCHGIKSAPVHGDGKSTRIGQALEEGARFEYRHFAAPSVPMQVSQINNMAFMHPPTETSKFSHRSSGPHFRGICAGCPAGYAGPGVYKIRMDSCIDPSKEDLCVGRYLKSTQHYRHSQPSKLCTWLGWTADDNQATFWQVRSAPGVDRVYIKVAIQSPRLTNSDLYLTAHNTIPSDHRDNESVFAMVCVNP